MLIALALLAACNNADEEQTLETCGTDIADDVPAFFSTYFRCVEASLDGDAVALWTDDLPPHPSPYYEDTHPNWEAFDDRGGEWFQNPNMLAAQDLSLSIALDPTPKGLTITDDLVDQEAGTSQEEYGGGGGSLAMGVALDGTAMFHGVAAPGDDIAEERYTFDLYEGHPEGTGVYHHHSPAPGALVVMEDAGFADVELYGIMCDGTVLLGCTELDGSAPADDLDAQQGHLHDVTDGDGTTHFAERYHTHLCGDVFTPEIQYYEGC